MDDSAIIIKERGATEHPTANKMQPSNQKHLTRIASNNQIK